jgi:heptosyltransferase-3
MDPEALRGKKIILFRTDRLGDLILTLPVVEALKVRLPETRIDLFTAPSNTCLGSLQPNVSEVLPHVYQGPGGLSTLVRVLTNREYGLAVHLYPRPALSLAAFLARIPLRAGTAYRAWSFLYNRRVRIHRKQMTTHERDLNLKLVEPLGFSTEGVSAGLTVPEALRFRLKDLLERASPGCPPHPFAVLHPGSGGSSLNWPAEQFAVLGKHLAAAGIQVVLTGTEIDRARVERVLQGMGPGAVNLCGRLDLVHLASLLSLASLTVSSSTGPLHLADALGGKVIGLYSRHFYASPRRWGPHGQPDNVFLPPGPPCARCAKDRCREYNCMASIRPEDVLAKAHTLIGRADEERDPPDTTGRKGNDEHRH